MPYADAVFEGGGVRVGDTRVYLKGQAVTFMHRELA